MNPSYNEREVLELLQDESTQKRGFELIVAQYSEQLYWQIRRMVLLHEDANDLLQNTFIKAWTNIDYFRGDAKLSTWLYRIALNECLTFLNKQRAVTTVSILHFRNWKAIPISPETEHRSLYRKHCLHCRKSNVWYST